MADAATRQDTGDFTMMFRVNGAAVYARGGSMIPMDLLNGRLSAEVRTETHFYDCPFLMRTRSFAKTGSGRVTSDERSLGRYVSAPGTPAACADRG